jgi:hypothetical protein
VSKTVKFKISKTTMKPVVTNGSETWPMTEKDMKLLNMWEIYGPVVELGVWRIITDQENHEDDIWTCARTMNMENKN